MRRGFGFEATIVGVVLMLAMGAVPAGAKEPPEVVVEEFDFVDVNPCTGQEHTVFVRLTMRVHEFENEVADRHHSNTQFIFDITTSDGFSGRVVGPDVHNHTGPAGDPSIFEDEEGTGMFASMANGVLNNRETGQRLRFRLVFQFVLVKGVPVVENFTEVYECFGRKAA